MAAIETMLRGRQDLPRFVGAFEGAQLLVIGGGRCVWDDLARADSSWGADRMAINDIGAYYEGVIQHWATLHVEYMQGWLAYRYGHNFGDGQHVWTHGPRSRVGIEFVWDIENQGGTSGLFGVIVALLMGYERIVLAGVPMDGSGHFFGPPDEKARQFEDSPVRKVWMWARDSLFEGRVTSLSGWTREMLGEPDGL